MLHRHVLKTHWERRLNLPTVMQQIVDVERLTESSQSSQTKALDRIPVQT